MNFPEKISRALARGNENGVVKILARVAGKSEFGGWAMGAEMSQKTDSSFFIIQKQI